jgi:hypothetical protein
VHVRSYAPPPCQIISQDIAIATGATFVAEEVGITLEQVTMDMLGSCDRLVVAKEQTTIVTDGSQNDAVSKRIAAIKVERDGSENQFDREKCEERIAALGGGVARIKVRRVTARSRFALRLCECVGGSCVCTDVCASASLCRHAEALLQ